MPGYSCTHRVVPERELDDLRDALLASPLVGRSTLGGSFRQSRGFAVTVTRAGLPEVTQRFPMLPRFLDLALERGPDLRPFRKRIFSPRRNLPETNAFYVNLLVLGPGGSVGRHVDATLRGPSGDEAALPQRVSVLYLEVPRPARGGELRLYEGERRVASLKPTKGTLVHFRGDLLHEVTALECAAADARRVSLVCEQYALGPHFLARLPPVKVQTKAGFDAYVQHFRERASR